MQRLLVTEPEFVQEFGMSSNEYANIFEEMIELLSSDFWADKKIEEAFQIFSGDILPNTGLMVHVMLIVVLLKFKANYSLTHLANYLSTPKLNSFFVVNSMQFLQRVLDPARKIRPKARGLSPERKPMAALAQKGSDSSSSDDESTGRGKFHNSLIYYNESDVRLF